MPQWRGLQELAPAKRPLDSATLFVNRNCTRQLEQHCNTNNSLNAAVSLLAAIILQGAGGTFSVTLRMRPTPNQQVAADEKQCFERHTLLQNLAYLSAPSD